MESFKKFYLGSDLINLLLNLKNITIIVDPNGYQSSTRTKDTHPTLYPIGKKFKYFGWEVSECNGHNTADIFKKLKK